MRRAVPYFDGELFPGLYLHCNILHDLELDNRPVDELCFPTVQEKSHKQLHYRSNVDFGVCGIVVVNGGAFHG
jgi:hypothetical protein